MRVLLITGTFLPLWTQPCILHLAENFSSLNDAVVHPALKLDYDLIDIKVTSLKQYRSLCLFIIKCLKVKSIFRIDFAS